MYVGLGSTHYEQNPMYSSLPTAECQCHTRSGPREAQEGSCFISTLEARKLRQKGVEGLGTAWGPRGAGDNPSPGPMVETGARSLGLEQLGRPPPRAEGREPEDVKGWN